MEKGRSPFVPGQPVPVELFTGRLSQIERILIRGAGQVAQGKPVAMFVEGEYGIGKSSVAGFVQFAAEKNYGLHGIYAPLGGAKNLADVAKMILEATLRSGALEPSRGEKIRQWLSKYIGEQKFGIFNVDFTKLKEDAPSLTSPFALLGFLEEIFRRLKETNPKGIFLILDEINGIANEPDFAHLIKGIVDTNALQRPPLPLFLMLCGVESRREQMIKNHAPIDRIFDIIKIDPMKQNEMQEFFKKAFESQKMTIEPQALNILTYYAAGFPKMMQLLGDAVFWRDQDGIIDEKDAIESILAAAEEVGEKYVEKQVLQALRSQDYKTILNKIAAGFKLTDDNFLRKDIELTLTKEEKKKLDNLLRRLEDLNVLRKGNIRGEYIFNQRMVRLYLGLSRSSANNV